MRRVGIKALKNNLSEYVRAAQAGETVLVTDRDRIVAELVPPRPEIGSSVKAILEQAAREGWYRPAETPHTEPLPDDETCLEGAVPLDQLLEDLARDREDRWKNP